MNQKAYVALWHVRHKVPGLYILALTAERRALQLQAEKLVERGCLAQAGMALQKADMLSAAISRAKKCR